MLEAVQLSKSDGSNRALAGLNLKLQAGEIFCLLGVNGVALPKFVYPLLGVLRITLRDIGVNSGKIVDCAGLGA